MQPKTQTQPKKRRGARIVLWSLISFLVISIGIFAAIPPLQMSSMVHMHADFEVHSPEKFGISADKLRLTTEDGFEIAAYDVTTETPKAVIIFLSGIHQPSVTAFFDEAAFFKQHGYASVLCEMRAHGESEGDLISVGYQEPLDVKAVIDYIQTQYEGIPIVIHGWSMGGATAITATGLYPQIQALISIAAYSSWEDVFADNMRLMGLPGFVCELERPFVQLYCGLLYGFRAVNENVPVRQIRNLDGRPAFLYHSRGDSQVPYASFERLIATGIQAEQMVIDGDFHYPEKGSADYETLMQRKLQFLDAQFR